MTNEPWYIPIEVVYEDWHIHFVILSTSNSKTTETILASLLEGHYFLVIANLGSSFDS